MQTHGQVKDEDVDCPGTVTSKFVDPLSSAEAATLSESVKHGESSGDLDARKFGKQEVKCSLDGSNEEKTEGLSACEGGGQLTTSRSCAAHPTKILQIELPKYLISYCHLINVILIFLEPPASPTCRVIH
ncbi:hypothetical protein LOK49_LG03G02162 [Camellia lanceoleosa]|uniref:Uncharacterized protein n=2 Tax=Camellia lanceoleosa TaxID=1840588 RepID=A0ACC0IEL8_9ERIC|nr:hypothetical protein LOK49_LG09G01385 [Camellia lanceoleosa]KAI8024031.1 hypothetical protein LOK49_LG03G02162 [Camellia lanceoleosa]